MKKCTWCGAKYSDEATTCPADQQPLVLMQSKRETDANETVSADTPIWWGFCFCGVIFFLIGLAVGVIGHLVFPWMIGNLQHAIETRSFVWNANQATKDSTFVMSAMIWVLERNVFSVALWSSLVLGIPFGFFVGIMPANKKLP